MGRHGRDRIVVGFTTTCAKAVPITTKVVSLNPVHGKVYSIQHYVINLSVLASGQWFSPGTPISFTNKTDRHDIIEILLKVALSTINQPITLNVI